MPVGVIGARSRSGVERGTREPDVARGADGMGSGFFSSVPTAAIAKPLATKRNPTPSARPLRAGAVLKNRGGFCGFGAVSSGFPLQDAGGFSTNTGGGKSGQWAAGSGENWT